MFHLNSILKLMRFSDEQSQHFKTLLTKTGCITANTPTFATPLEALSWLREITQQHWLRKPGSERWDQSDTDEMRSQHQEFIDLFGTLGILAAKNPKLKHYDHVLLMGALETRVRTRLEFFLNKNITTNHFIVLGGKRTLIKETEATAHRLGENPTEFEMMKAVIEEHTSKNPQTTFAKTNKVWVDTPMQKTGDGKKRRPNTADTVRYWQQQYQPKSGTILVVSNQPFVDYQHTMVVSNIFNHNNFTIETCGHQASSEEPISTVLDSLARWIFGDFKRLEQILTEQAEKAASESYKTDRTFGKNVTDPVTKLINKSDDLTQAKAFSKNSAVPEASNT